MTWALVILVHVGPMGSGNSNSLTQVQGFKSEATCMEAGKKAKGLTSGTTKETTFVCVEVK